MLIYHYGHKFVLKADNYQNIYKVIFQLLISKVGSVDAQWNVAYSVFVRFEYRFSKYGWNYVGLLGPFRDLHVLSFPTMYPSEARFL